MIVLNKKKVFNTIADVMSAASDENSNVKLYGPAPEAIANTITICTEIIDRLKKLPTIDTSEDTVAHLLEFVIEGDCDHE